MRALYHTDALSNIFLGNLKLDDFERSIINTSKIVLTDEIIEDYNLKFGDNQIYQDWISSLLSHLKIEKADSTCIKSKLSEIKKPLDNYDIGSYYSDQEIISLKNNSWWNNEISINTPLKSFLTEERNASNPYKTIIMETNGKIGFDLFLRYLKVEKEIYIYDQYINHKSKRFLEYVYNNISDGAYVKVFLFKEDGNCFSANQLNSCFNSTKIKFYRVTPTTAASIHDRFINFGKRIQVAFSKGLDQFNPIIKNKSITFNNEDSTISFFDILNSNKNYEIESNNGPKIKIPKRY